MQEEILITKGQKQSKQSVGRDTLLENGIIEPFINVNELLAYYYKNVYHQRAINIKARLLSQVSESSLNKHLPPNTFLKDLLLPFVLDSEIYGNAYLERAGTVNDFWLYHILGYEARVNKDKEIYQITSDFKKEKLEGHHFKYHSPISKYYGQPDYLTTLEQIDTSKMADKYNSTFFTNGARPGFVIAFENSSPNDAQQNAFKQFFGQNYKGYENSHKSILFHTGKTKEGESPAKIHIQKLDGVEDMSFKNLKEVNRDEIIVSHGVPPRLVGIISAGQLGGGKELIDQLHMFNEIEIKPKANQLEEFFDNIKIKHKVKELDVTNFKDDSDLVTNLVAGGIIDKVQAKEILGLNLK